MIYRVREGKSHVPFDGTMWSIEPSGLIGRPLLMGQGAVVIGRVVRDGKPVSGISMILTFHDDLPDIEAKTDDQGHFRMARVATGQHPEQAIYSKPGSLPDHQTVIPCTFMAGLDGVTVNLGDFEVQLGRTLAGRVIVSDGKPLDRDAKVLVRQDDLFWFSAGLDEAGRFEVKGIPDGRVSIYMMGITGYRLSPRNKCLDHTLPDHLAGMISRDITDLTILIQPGLAPEPGTLTTDELDPALVADFEDAKAGPITGIAPGKLRRISDRVNAPNTATRREAREIRAHPIVAKADADSWLEKFGESDEDSAALGSEGRSLQVPPPRRERGDRHHPAREAGRGADRLRFRGRLVRLPAHARSEVPPPDRVGSAVRSRGPRHPARGCRGMNPTPSGKPPHGLCQPWHSGSRRSASDGPQVPGS